VHTLQLDVVKLSEIEARFNQRSGQIVADLAEIAAQEARSRCSQAESEEKFEQLDMDWQPAGRHEEGQTPSWKEQRLADAREALRELERAAQEAQFAEKSQRSRIEELRRNIATASAAGAAGGREPARGQTELAGAGSGHRERRPAGPAGPPHAAGKSAVRRAP
jgi:chromosome segregation protein